MNQNPYEAPQIGNDAFIRRTRMKVLLSGLLTTAGTIAVVMYALCVWKVNFLGIYLKGGLIPAWAIGMGLIGGSGYGIAAWLTGARVDRSLVVTIVLLQLVAYVVIRYTEFWLVHPNLPHGLVSFCVYFDSITRTFAFVDLLTGKAGEPFGPWGYLFRTIEIACFSLTAIVAATRLLGKPYCGKCQFYMRRKNVGFLPAGVVPRFISRDEPEQLKQHQEAERLAIRRGDQLFEKLAWNVGTRDASRLLAFLAEHGRKKGSTEALSSHFKLVVDYCPACKAGEMIINKVNGTWESGTQIEERIRTPVDGAYVREILG